MALTNGSVQLKDLRTNAKDKCMLVAQTDSAIWDMQLWKAAEGVKLVTAEDSGKVNVIDLRATNQITTLTVKQLYIF